MKRQSTVEKLSSNKLQAIIAYMTENHCGFILRYKGVEYGLRLVGDDSLLVEWCEASKYGHRWFNTSLSLWLKGKAISVVNLMVRKGWSGLGGHPHTNKIVESIMELLGYPPIKQTPFKQVEGELQICRQYASSWSQWEEV